MICFERDWGSEGGFSVLFVENRIPYGRLMRGLERLFVKISRYSASYGGFCLFLGVECGVIWGYLLVGWEGSFGYCIVSYPLRGLGSYLALKGMLFPSTVLWGRNRYLFLFRLVAPLLYPAPSNFNYL